MIQISVVHIRIHWGGGGGCFPYGALCGLFWWDCVLRVYRISHLG